jgi:hypothetical protein
MYPEEDVAAEQGKTSRRVPSWRIVKGKFLGTMAPSPFSFRIVHVEFCSRIMPVMNIREAAPANRPARSLGVTGMDRIHRYIPGTHRSGDGVRR